MKALLDINVVLDVLLVRQPWCAEASRVWDAHVNGKVTAAIAAFTVPTVFYIMRRHTDLSHAHDAVRICLNTLEIVPVLRTSLESARALAGSTMKTIFNWPVQWKPKWIVSSHAIRPVIRMPVSLC